MNPFPYITNNNTLINNQLAFNYILMMKHHNQGSSPFTTDQCLSFWLPRFHLYTLNTLNKYISYNLIPLAGPLLNWIHVSVDCTCPMRLLCGREDFFWLSRFGILCLFWPQGRGLWWVSGHDRELDRGKGGRTGGRIRRRFACRSSTLRGIDRLQVVCHVEHVIDYFLNRVY